MSRELTRESERRRIEKSFEVFHVSEEQQALIREALDSDRWDWFRDCDGCTGVSDLHWPTRYFPPCLRHDYDWITGNGELTGSKIFYRLQRAYGVPKWRSGVRTAGVTVFWNVWGRWRQKRTSKCVS
jgi:hypothetical protein